MLHVLVLEARGASRGVCGRGATTTPLRGAPRTTGRWARRPVVGAARGAKTSSDSTLCLCACVPCMQAGEGGGFLDDPRIDDYYRVQFTRDADRGRPVGGDFRYSALGRAFFRTEEAYQHVLGKQAVNMLFFTFAGFCPGCIVLSGELQRCGEDERAAVAAKFRTPPPGLSPQTIKVCVRAEGLGLNV